MPNNVSVKTNDRILVLKAKPGQSPTKESGLVDNSLFTGGNELHAVRDNQTSFWTLKYKHGIVPQSFQQQFTTWQKLMDHVKGYYDKRNIDITEIIDA